MSAVLEDLLLTCRRGAFDHVLCGDGGDGKGGAMRGEGLLAMRRPVLGQVRVQEGRELSMAAALVLANAQAWSSKQLDDQAIADQLLAEFDSPDGFARGLRLSSLLAHSSARAHSPAASAQRGREVGRCSQVDAAAGASGQHSSGAAVAQAGPLAGADAREAQHKLDLADDTACLGSTCGGLGGLRLPHPASHQGAVEAAASHQGAGQDAPRHAPLPDDAVALASSRPEALIHEPPLPHPAGESLREAHGAAAVCDDETGAVSGAVSDLQHSFAPASSRLLRAHENQDAGPEAAQGAPTEECGASEEAVVLQPRGMVLQQEEDARAVPAAVPTDTAVASD